jgi:hypothetical protein
VTAQVPGWQADTHYDGPPVEKKHHKKPKADIPKIRLWSKLGAESVIWGIAIAHIVKWIGNALYFLVWQVRYSVGYGPTTFTWWNMKDTWDRLPVHISNLLGQHWFVLQTAPLWWITWRHDIRDVGISFFATVIVEFMFTKPKYALDDAPSVKRYAITLPAAVGLALIPISIIGVLAWQLPWIMRHGWQIPPAFGGLASEVNGFIAAGAWIAVLMGISGGVAAKPMIKRVADDVQWFYAQVSAFKILSKREGRGGLAGQLDSAFSGTVLRSDRVIGTPVHRSRVHWILEHRPDTPARSPWLTRILAIIGMATVPLAIFGAWLTIWGPAAVH